MGQSTDAIIAYGLQFCPEEADNDAVAEAFDGRFDELEKEAKELGLDVVWHCSSDYAMFILGHEALTASRGNPLEVDLEKLSHAEIEYAAINGGIEELCKKFNLPFDETKCKWWLCSYWG